jgi:hypothetical protein
MNVEQLSELVGEFNYLLARISRYLKNNQYVYLRAFNSWLESYNDAAKRLNADGTIRVPIFKLSPIDYSSSGKSIRQASVEKFVKTINQQIVRLEEKIFALSQPTEDDSDPPPLAKFFPRDADGFHLEPPRTEQHILVVIPPGADKRNLFHGGIQPALEDQGRTSICIDQPVQDDAALCELCQAIHSCRLAIFDLTGQAANVMLALGLAHGSGKPVVILQQQSEEPLGAIHSVGHLRYASAANLKTRLGTLLREKLKS